MYSDVLPLHAGCASTSGNFLWFADIVNLSLALSLPSVKRIVLVWKSVVSLTSFFVILLTKCMLLAAVAEARGGGVGASDISTSFLVEMIG